MKTGRVSRSGYAVTNGERLMNRWRRGSEQVVPVHSGVLSGHCTGGVLVALQAGSCACSGLLPMTLICGSNVSSNTAFENETDTIITRGAAALVPAGAVTR